jgi:uncharacterized membrane protein
MSTLTVQPQVAEPVVAPARPVKYRIESIDVVRGIVMLIMAIDHVRDIFHAGHPEPTDLSVTTPILFFTRWITHFCAPTFVFLSGMSAYLAGTRRTLNQFSAFLLKRGAWLIVVEVVLITFGITLNPRYNVLILQVIWAIGGSMILLGLAVRLRLSAVAIGIIGAVVFFGHNIFDVVNVGSLKNAVYWRMLVSAAGFNSFIPLDKTHVMLAAYALLPWTGVMFCGYYFGTFYRSSFNATRRRSILLYSGLALLALFFVFRYFNIYGDPSPWKVQKTTTLTIISFFDVTKYPCSLIYLSMTLGCALILLSRAELVKNAFTGILVVYGNVPFFYYVCHWYLIQAIHVILFFAAGFKASQVVAPNVPFLFSPPNFGFGLGVVYLIWLFVIVALYLPCRWYSQYKKNHQQWWLSYV